MTEEGFSITLNFGNSPEPLVIPFDAVKTFVDPSVEFGLRFESHADDDEYEDDDGDDGDDDPDDDPPREAEVVRLDSWRK